MKLEMTIKGFRQDFEVLTDLEAWGLFSKRSQEDYITMVIYEMLDNDDNRQAMNKAGEPAEFWLVAGSRANELIEDDITDQLINDLNEELRTLKKKRAITWQDLLNQD